MTAAGESLTRACVEPTGGESETVGSDAANSFCDISSRLEEAGADLQTSPHCVGLHESSPCACCAFSCLVSASAAARAPARLPPALLSAASAAARAPARLLPVLLSVGWCLRLGMRARQRKPRSGSCPCCLQLRARWREPRFGSCPCCFQLPSACERGSASSDLAPSRAAFSRLVSSVAAQAPARLLPMRARQREPRSGPRPCCV